MTMIKMTDSFGVEREIQQFTTGDEESRDLAREGYAEELIREFFANPVQLDELIGELYDSSRSGDYREALFDVITGTKPRQVVEAIQRLKIIVGEFAAEEAWRRAKREIK